MLALENSCPKMCRSGIRKLISSYEISAESSKQHHQGFVLPIVLVTILVLSIISLLGASAISRAQSTLLEFQNRSATERSFDQTEDQFAFTYLTSPFVRTGLDTSGRAIDETALALGEPPSEGDLAPGDIWPAKRGAQRFEYERRLVLAVYQDAESLIPLNSATSNHIEKWIAKARQLSGNEARSLSAKLGDYIDPDNERRFLGAERADYRLLGRSPPPNTFLRSIYELNEIADWDELAVPGWRDLAQVTLFLNGPLPKISLIPDDVSAVLELSEDQSAFSDTPDMLAEQIALFPFPGERAQLILFAVDRGSSVVFVRALELERTTTAPDRPYTRRQIWEVSTTREEAQKFLSEAGIEGSLLE